MRRPGLIVVTLLAFVAPLQAQLQPTPRGEQVKHARSLTPPDLALPRREPPAATGEPRRLRVRVWTTDDYDAQTFRWKERLRSFIKHVNQVLVPWPNVELELVDTRAWTRASAGVPLGALLDDLRRLDDGKDVDLVLGLVSGLERMPTSIHQLGMADELGVHAVMRSLDDAGEAQQIATMFDSLWQAERDALLRARRTHKELVVFLHEWGHTLGALHTAEATDLMNAEYGTARSGLSDENAHLMSVALRHRFGGQAGWREAMRAEMAKYLEANPRAWDGGERRDLLARLRSPERPPSPAPTSATPSVAPARPGDPAAYEQARALYGEHKPAEAWTLLEPVATANPDHPQIQLLACAVAVQAAPPPRSQALCRRATELNPTDVWPALTLANIQLTAGRHEDAESSLARARQRLEYGPATPAQWRALVELYRRVSLVSLAESAAAHVGDDAFAAETARWAVQQRRRLAIPAAGLAPDKEGDYTRLLISSDDIIDGEEVAAGRFADEAQRRYPDLPGSLLVRSRLAWRRANLVEADALCRRAIARQPDAVQAHVQCALVASARGKNRVAVTDLERALDLDPELQPVWSLLRRAYTNQNNTAALRKLTERYNRQFPAGSKQ